MITFTRELPYEGHKHEMFTGTMHALEHTKRFAYCPTCDWSDYMRRWAEFTDKNGRPWLAVSVTCDVCNNTMPASGCKDCTQTHDRKGTK